MQRTPRQPGRSSSAAVHRTAAAPAATSNYLSDSRPLTSSPARLIVTALLYAIWLAWLAYAAWTW